MIIVIHKFELLTKKKVIKKKGNSSNNIDRNTFRTNLKVACCALHCENAKTPAALPVDDLSQQNVKHEE